MFGKITTDDGKHDWHRVILVLCSLLLLILIIAEFSGNHFFNDLSDRAEYIQHFYSLYETGFLAQNTIRVPLFLSYFYFYLSQSFGFINYTVYSSVLLLFSIISLGLFFSQFQKRSSLPSLSQSKRLLAFGVLFFFNTFVLYLFKGIYAELYFLPLLFFGLYLVDKKQIILGSLIFLCALLTKIEMFVLFPLWIFWYILFVYEKSKDTAVLIIQNVFFLLGVYTLFVYWDLSYLQIYYGLDISWWLLGIIAVCMIVGQYIVFIMRKYILASCTPKVIKIILLCASGLFLIANPLYYLLSGGTFDTAYIAKNLATATDLDLINILRLGLVVGLLPLFGVVYYIKERLLPQLHERKILAKEGFFYVLFFVVLMFLFYESYHEPNLLIWSRRFIGIVIPCCVFFLVVFLKKMNNFIVLLVITVGVVSSVLFNAQYEYGGYTAGVRDISETITEQCDNKVVLYDSDVYTHEAMYTALFTKNDVYRYSQLPSRDDIPCFLIPQRLIGEQKELLAGKSEVKLFSLSFEKHEWSLFALPEHKTVVTYDMILYK